MLKYLLFIFVAIPYAQAQYSLGGKNDAMAANAVTGTNVWAVHGNAAGISQVLKPTFAADYRQHFMSKEMKSIAATAVFPIQNQYFIAAGLYRYGIDVYQESKYALSYAQKFGSHLALAINQNFHQLSVKNYFQKVGYSIDFGAQWKCSDKVLLAANWQNIGFLGYVDQQNQVFPAQVAIGALWQVDASVQVSSGFYYPLQSFGKPAFRMGLDYALLPAFSIRGGMISAPFSFHAGFGTRFSSFTLDMAYSHLQVLGGQTQFTLAYEW